MVLYATPWLIYGIGASTRGHHEDNGFWLMGFAGMLIAVALLGLCRSRLAGWILVVPSIAGVVFVTPLMFVYD